MKFFPGFLNMFSFICPKMLTVQRIFFLWFAAVRGDIFLSHPHDFTYHLRNDVSQMLPLVHTFLLNARAPHLTIYLLTRSSYIDILKIHQSMSKLEHVFFPPSLPYILLSHRNITTPWNTLMFCFPSNSISTFPGFIQLAVNSVASSPSPLSLPKIFVSFLRYC